jgi:hypothetical protein
MADILRPRPKAWKNKQEEVDASDDRVLFYCQELSKLFMENYDPPVVQLAALRLMQKTLTMFLAEAVGPEGAKEALKQAAELADSYTIVETK